MGGVGLDAGRDATVLEGAPLRLRIDGLPKGTTAIVHSFRILPKYTDKGSVDVAMHGWAEFRAGRNGIDVDAATPRRGSYRRASGLALLWSQYPADDPAIPVYARQVAFTPPKGSLGRTFLVLEEQGRAVASGSFRVVASPDVAYLAVHEVGLDGVFACPKGASRRPVVISLHGSEGGSAESAHQRAEEFAEAGFATFAVNYFAYPGRAIPGVPTSHADIPVETIVRARDWLAGRPEANIDRLGLYGVSKGAEFAVLAASTYDWVEAVVAVVPSDAVWEGYRGEGGEAGTSSWSLGGKSLPYIPLYPLEVGRYRVNTERYERSRRDHPAEAKAAEIPIGRSKARFLLLGSDRDETWASGAQIRRLVGRMAKAGRKDRVEAVVFPTAGHQISGPGDFPPRLYGIVSGDPKAKDLTDEGAAAEESWRRTVDFLKKNL